MLTLGLMEGVLSATAGILVLMIAVNENAPLHKIFGPLVVAVVGVAAYSAHDAGAMHYATNVVGLGFFATVAFFVPLAVMRYCWKTIRAMNDAAIEGKLPAPSRKAPAAVTHEVRSPDVSRKVA